MGGIGIFDNAFVKLHRVLIDSPSMTGVDVQVGRLEASELTVEDSGDHGIRIDGNSTAQVTMCEIIRSGLSGIRVVSESAVSINNCKITAGLDYGIHFFQGSQAEVSSCLISKNLAGICIEEGANPNILSNLIEGNLEEGLRLVGVGGGSVDLTVFERCADTENTNRSPQFRLFAVRRSSQSAIS